MDRTRLVSPETEATYLAHVRAGDAQERREEHLRAIRRLLDLGTLEAEKTMRAYVQTVPALVREVMTERFGRDVVAEVNRWP